MDCGDMRYLRTQRHDRQHGFNLIELALALAVVGLVGAGIWVAASAAQDARRTNETVEQVRLIVENIRDHYATSAQLPNEDFNTFTQTVDDADLFPAETRLSANAFVNPWSSDGTGSICGDGTICVSTINAGAIVGGVTINQSTMIIMLRRLPGRACIGVASRFLNMAPEIGLIGIGTDTTDNPLPTNVDYANMINIAWLTANCDAANPNNLYLGFRLAP